MCPSATRFRRREVSAPIPVGRLAGRFKLQLWRASAEHRLQLALGASTQGVLEGCGWWGVHGAGGWMGRVGGWMGDGWRWVERGGDGRWVEQKDGRSAELGCGFGFGEGEGEEGS